MVHPPPAPRPPPPFPLGDLSYESNFGAGRALCPRPHLPDRTASSPCLKIYRTKIPDEAAPEQPRR